MKGNTVTKNNRRMLYRAAAFSLIVAFIYSVGNKMLIGKDPMGSLGISWKSLLCTFVICFFAVIIACLCIQLLNSTEVKNKQSEQYIIFPLLSVFSILFFCIYGIAFLCFFPGTSYLDTLVIMLNGMMMGNQYPVLYCFMITILTKLGEILGSLKYTMIIYSIIQLLIVSVLSAWLCVWIWNKKTFAIIKWCTFFFLALNPVLAVYAISVIKDTVFSLAVIVIVTIVFDLFTGKESLIHWILFGFCTACLIIYRNNGLYILLPLLMILFFRLPEKCRKKTAVLFLEIILLLSAVKLLQWRFDIEPLFKESMAIPLQQISAVVKYNEDSMTASQKEFVNSYLDLALIKENYDGAYADPIKWHDDFDDAFFDSHKKEFLQLWLQLLPENFGLYVKAYLEETFWYWYPGNYGDTLLITWLGGGVPEEWLSRNGLIISPLIKGDMLKSLLSYYYSGRKYPNEGTWIWFMFFCCFLRELTVRDKKSVLVFLAGILCWITIMLSAPINSGTRYALPFIYGTPVFFSMLFITNDKKTRNNNPPA